jgi:hypothetical protein
MEAMEKLVVECPDIVKWSNTYIHSIIHVTEGGRK